MNAMRSVGMVATVAFVFALPILLFTTNIRFLASDTGFLEGGLRRHDAAETTGIAQGELDYAVGEIVRYFQDDAETLNIRVFAQGEEITLFNEDETAHMEDVKWLMRTIFRANEVALGFVLAYIAGTVLWARERSGQALAKQTLSAVGVGAAVGVAVGVLAIVGFDGFWDRLHEVVFANDLWRLDPDEDRLIQMFPESFWEEATLIVVGLALAEAAVLVAVAGGYLWFTRRSRGDGDITGESPATPSEASESGDVGDEEGLADAGEQSEQGEQEAQEPQPQPPPPQAQPPEALKPESI